MNESSYFLPYQARWIKDDSEIKIFEKSRRIGATFGQSYEDVRDLLKHGYDVYFSSADESAAREYILYCEKWVRLLKAICEPQGLVVIDKEKDIKGYVIEFANRCRICALSSNPKRFRSKGGKVVLDEFAWHDDQEAMWAAAEPATTWGFPIRILSTYNGKGNLYFKFIDDIKRSNSDWSLHTTTIYNAVDEGLLDKIKKRPTTQEERDKWIEDKKRRVRLEDKWLQEYCCIPVDESTALLTYEMIAACESKIALAVPITGDLYVGMDIGRRKDLTVIWAVERLGHALYTRHYQVLEKAPFRHQKDALYSILRHPNMRRACIDATGLGMQMAEEAQSAFGKFRVECVTFTPAVKEDLAVGLVPYFQDKAIEVPEDFHVREDLHSVRKTVTTAGNIRYDVARTEEQSHADRFWALALSVHAAGSKISGPFYTASRPARRESAIIRGY